MIQGVHHIGLTVDDLDAAVAFYQGEGFTLVDQTQRPEQGGASAFLTAKDRGALQLWHFDEPNSEVARIMKHHVALESDDLEGDLDRFVADGFQKVIDITPGHLTKRFAFVMDAAGNSVELVEP